jgi:hypothetical protein
VKDPEEAKKYARILKSWIDFEHANIVRIAMGMYWTLGPDKWRANIPLESYQQWRVVFFVNPQNLYYNPSNPYRPTVTENLVNSARAVASAIREHRRHNPALHLPGITPDMEAALNDLIRAASAP